MGQTPGGITVPDIADPVLPASNDLLDLAKQVELRTIFPASDATQLAAYAAAVAARPLYGSLNGVLMVCKAGATWTAAAGDPYLHSMPSAFSVVPSSLPGGTLSTGNIPFGVTFKFAPIVLLSSKRQAPFSGSGVWEIEAVTATGFTARLTYANVGQNGVVFKLDALAVGTLA